MHQLNNSIPNIITQVESREGGINAALPLPRKSREVVCERPSALKCAVIHSSFWLHGAKVCSCSLDLLHPETWPADWSFFQDIGIIEPTAASDEGIKFSYMYVLISSAVHEQYNRTYYTFTLRMSIGFYWCVVLGVDELACCIRLLKQLVFSSQHIQMAFSKYIGLTLVFPSRSVRG